MATYIKKERTDILRQALRKLEEDTPIRSVSAGSIARAFTEAITTELGDLYDALDYNLAQSVVTTATGSALDLIGELYSIKRRTVSDLVALDRKIGSFYFYIDTPYMDDITIPKGTKIYTATDSFVGRQLRYATTADANISAGKTRTFASIIPEFSAASFTAGPGTLVINDFTSPPGVVVKCTNPKAVAAQQGFEDDNNYRLRIIKSIRVTASGTIDAVRFAALGISGVRDVKIREAPYGLGSLEVLVTADTNGIPTASMVELQRAIKAVRPAGIRLYIKSPRLLAVDISASIVMGPNAVQSDVTTAEKRTTIAVQRYLNSLLPGDTLIYNKLIQSIFESTDGILDVQITRYAPNGVEALRRNFTPEEDEQLIPGAVTMSQSS